MHDSGCFTEQLVDQLIVMIFKHYDKAAILEFLGVDNSEAFVKASLNLPESRKDILRNIINKHA